MSETEIVTKKITKDKIKEPSKYKVVVINDNVTTMEFVVSLLMTIFKHDEEESVRLTMKIHNDGSAVAGIYSHEIAEQKVIDSITMARTQGFPLIVKAEKE
jgi:ATP-dependent Clp protease adaptor protein ClpS